MNLYYVDSTSTYIVAPSMTEAVALYRAEKGGEPNHIVLRVNSYGLIVGRKT